MNNFLVRLFLGSLIISVILSFLINYGTITNLLIDSPTYWSDEDLFKSINLENFSSQEKAFLIYSLVKQSLEHKFTYYSFFENPVSVIVEAFIFAPLYKVITKKDSEFINTIRQPYLLFNLGGGICHQASIAVSVLARKAGLKARVIWLNGHVVSEIYYDNHWHLFDADEGIIFKKNGYVLSYEEITNYPQIIKKVLEKSDWEPKRIQNMVNIYINKPQGFYNLHPYEIYIDVYYWITQILSYTIYFMVLFIILYATSYVSKMKRIFIK